MIMAAAIAGLKPARTRIGISVGATAAEQPAVLGSATATTAVTRPQAGRRNRPSFFRGFVRSETRCVSQPVSFTTAAKPMAEQMAMIRFGFVIDLSN